MNQDIRDRALKLLLFEDYPQCISRHLLLLAIHPYCHFDEAYRQPRPDKKKDLASHSTTKCCGLHLAAYFGMDITMGDL
jgi:hypothetical protein